jgi:hypothetical protein
MPFSEVLAPLSGLKVLRSMLASRSTVVGDHKHTGGVMRLAARSKFVGTLALAVAVGGLACGTSVGHVLTAQQIARIAQQSRQDPASVSQAPVLRSNPRQQTTQARIVAPPILRVARASELSAINRAEAREHAAGSYGPSSGARYSNAESAAYATLSHPVAASAPTANAPGDGFDYAAAAIGAGAAALIIVAIAAGSLAVRRRGQPQHG